MSDPVVNSFFHQRSFAEYCRTGFYTDIPGVDPEKVKHYRRLVFNVFEDSLRAAYPLTYKLLEEQEWNDLVSQFMIDHNSSDPQVWKMPKEFYEYIAEGHEISKKYPQIIDLLKFEWYEIEIYMQEDINIIKDINIINDDKINLNPNHVVLVLEFPVHIKPANDIHENDKGHYFVSLHRRPDNFKVIFNDLAQGSATILYLLSQTPYTLDELFQVLNEVLNVSIDSGSAQDIRRFIDWGYETQLFLKQSI